MPLGEVVKALRDSRGWGTARLAKAVRAQGGLAKRVASAHIQNVESKGTRPRYIAELAATFGKTVDELLSWRPGMPTEGPNEPKPALQDATEHPEGKLPMNLTIHRLEHDIDQLRTTVLNLMDVVISMTPVSGMAAELVERLETDAAAKDDPSYEGKGFHARVLSTLRTIVRTQAAGASTALPYEDRGPSRRKRAP